MEMDSTLAHRARWRRHDGRKTLGVVMIVKNEAANLPHLFRTLVPVADEVVVVDTGSTDDTLAVCEAWGVRVVVDPWRDDFSHARNRSIREATAKYLLWLDADDRLPEATQKYLAWLRDGALLRVGDKAFVMEVRNLNAAGEEFDTFLQTRLFPRLPGVEFRYRVHEQIADSLRERRVELVKLDVAIEHTGYRDAEVNRAKAIRNRELLQAELARDPGNLHTVVHVAQTHFALREYAEAERQLSAAMELASPSTTSAGFRAELHSLRALYRLRTGAAQGVFEDLERAAELWPEWAVPHTSLAELHLLAGRDDLAWERLETARRGSFAATIFGFPVVQVRRNLEFFSGRILLRRGERERAIAHLTKALEIVPRDLEARLELGQALLDLERYPDALEVLEPAGRDESATPHFVQIAAAIGLGRAMSGDVDGAGACLAPLLEIFADSLGGAAEAGPLELAEAMLQAGHTDAARNMITLYQQTLQPAA